MPQPTSTPAQEPSPLRGEFREIARIEDTDVELGLFVVITERVSDGKISFCIFRGFERVVAGTRNGRERSTYMGQRHINGMHRLLKEVDRRLDSMEERARGERRAAAGQP